MQRNVLVSSLAVVFGGMAVVLVVVAVLFQWGLLLLAVPLGVTASFMWYHASGRLRARVRERATGRRERTGRGGRRTAATGPRGREAPGSNGRRDGRYTRSTVPGAETDMRPAEAARVLGVDPSEDETTIKRAYRSKVKDAHPDADGGDEEEFKRIQTAYETLSESQ